MKSQNKFCREARHLQEAKPVPKGPWNASRLKGVRRRGQLYERDFSLRMQAAHGKLYRASQWWAYRMGGKEYYAQTDGLLVLPDEMRMVIFECKLTHTASSYFQLYTLYRPILECAFPGWDLRLVTVVKNYDPHIDYPVKTHFMESLEDLPKPKQIGVYVWQK